jgi:hypothetical protein
MLPSEKAELWVRRVGYTVLILLALYIVQWIAGFVYRVARQVLEQRRPPPEACLHLIERG